MYRGSSFGEAKHYFSLTFIHMRIRASVRSEHLRCYMCSRLLLKVLMVLWTVAQVELLAPIVQRVTELSAMNGKITTCSRYFYGVGSCLDLGTSVFKVCHVLLWLRLQLAWC